ncbi:uncharacterized serine-rich protein C215.13 [Syzygium oleosum]|uniref:uncharacterized serine-rich protein C215.13 n=1 Tax=Syzygium oleosum TaxID=219896 RepID=UPI0011D2A999|nr:uncharacterized serine-rich protein C215.13 [Syzygium oleosum]
MNRSPNPRNHQETSFQIKQDGKFFSRLLSRESSATNTSSRLLYYGGAARSVPFTWESQPGTPKHAFSGTSLRPLTPPPSSSTPALTCSGSSSQGRRRKRNVSMSAVFSRLTPKRSHRASPSSSVSSGSTSSSSGSSYNSSPSTSRFRIHRQFFSCSGSSMHYGSYDDNEDIGDEKEDGYGSPDSTLSFGERRKYSNKFRGCYSMGNVKKRFMSILGQKRGTY